MNRLVMEVVGLAVIAVLGFIYGRYTSAVAHARQEAAWQAKYDAQVATTESIEERWNTEVRRRDEWKAKAAAARHDAVDVARQLRISAARRCPVPAAAAAAAGTGSPGAEPAESGGTAASELTLEWHFGNCAADAADFESIRDLYNRVRAAQQP